LVCGTLAARCFGLPAGLPAQGQALPDEFRTLHAKPDSAVLPRGDGKPAKVSAYDGIVPGPLLRVRRGDEVKVRLVNGLTEPSAIHWHGVRLANAMDGTPPLTQAPVKPGESFDYRFIARDAGTFWYHPPEPAGQGLYGMLIVDEPSPVEVDRDIAIILDHADRAVGNPDQIIVNGAQAFQIPVKVNERVRLRFLNVASASFISARVDRHRVMVMAVDGQPAQPFEARSGRVFLGPGNRADVFVDCTLTPGATAPILFETGAEPVPIAHLAYGPDSIRPSPLPDSKPLPANPLPERIELRGATRPEFPITDGASIALPPKPLFTVKRGRTVVLNTANRTAIPQVTHVHGHAFRVLDRLDDGWKPYWLDTIAVEPHANDHVAFVADNPGKWLIRANAQATSMLAWFEVT
jgi:FtsP/CotA-like multicopper oxidase with cupredoxin domain